jgi:hypothetical protein
MVCSVSIQCIKPLLPTLSCEVPFGVVEDENPSLNKNFYVVSKVWCGANER